MSTEGERPACVRHEARPTRRLVALGCGVAILATATTAWVRAAGFKGFSCNLTLLGQSRGDGASWQHAFFKDGAGHSCSYYDTSSSTVNRTHQGVVTIDATDPTKPTPTAYLTTIAMNDPWESLKVNDRRQLLGAVNALNGNGGPEIDLYDLSGDCRFPQLLTSTAVGKGSTPDELVLAVRGHEGNFTPDGLTYYGSNLSSGYVYAIDITNSTKPKLIASWSNRTLPAGMDSRSATTAIGCT